MRGEYDHGGALQAEATRSITIDDPSPVGQSRRAGAGLTAASALRTMRRDEKGGAGRNAPLPLRLQFSPDAIPHLAAAYRLDAKEDAAFAAGTRIRDGAPTRANLAPILTWKVSDRGRGRQQRNSDAEIADALRAALLANTPRVAIAVLTGLSGVAVPVASAILAAIRPEHYTVIDARAFRALGCGPLEIGFKASLPLDFYLHYLTFCRDLAVRCDVTLPVLERALWQWAKAEGSGARVARGF